LCQFFIFNKVYIDLHFFTQWMWILYSYTILHSLKWIYMILHIHVQG
jgi:hypothetical protein